MPKQIPLSLEIKYVDSYLAGTEEGHIHRCSCSYNEQYLDSYFGHQGPVYSIKWSPFSTEIFLSCSGDWSIRLWHQDRLKPILNFFSSTVSSTIEDSGSRILCWYLNNHILILLYMAWWSIFFTFNNHLILHTVLIYLCIDNFIWKRLVNWINVKLKWTIMLIMYECMHFVP